MLSSLLLFHHHHVSSTFGYTTSFTLFNSHPILSINQNHIPLQKNQPVNPNQNPNHPQPSTPSLQVRETTQNKTNLNIRKSEKTQKLNLKTSCASSSSKTHCHQANQPLPQAPPSSHCLAIAARTSAQNCHSSDRLCDGAPLLEA